jgi:hypothetical protein
VPLTEREFLPMRYLVLILCVAAGQANAGAAGTATTYGAGTESCGKWVASGNDDVWHHLQLNWVLGWISAAGHYNVHGNLKETDSDAISAWVDNYCKEHPLDDISEAAAALVRELAKHKA